MTPDEKKKFDNEIYETVVLHGTALKDDRAWLINRLAKEVRELRQEKDDALQVILKTQELAGCDGLSEVIRRAKAYPKLTEVIARCVRLADLMMGMEGYTTETGNALLQECEEESGDAG